MKTLRIAIPLLVMVLLAGAPTFGQSADEKFHDDIRELMVLTGAEGLAKQMMDQMLVSMKQSMPQVPDEFWKRTMAQFKTGQLVDMTVPIYAKHFTHDEIKALVGFYSSPTGRAVTAKMPLVLQESMSAGQRWGQQIGEQVARELAEEGYQ